MAPRRIRGRYRAWYEPEVPTIRAAVYLPRIIDTQFKIDFLIDTGSAKTILMPSDSDAMGLDVSDDFAHARSEAAGGIGGEMRYWLEPGQILLRTEEGLTDFVGLDIAIAQPSEFNLILPSPLGRDIL